MADPLTCPTCHRVAEFGTAYCLSCGALFPVPARPGPPEQPKPVDHVPLPVSLHANRKLILPVAVAAAVALLVAAIMSIKPRPSSPPTAVPQARLDLRIDIDCRDWGLHVAGVVANPGDRAIARVLVFHGPVGSTPENTFELTQDRSGSFAKAGLETWIPDYERTAFPDGSTVRWRLTVHLSDGSIVESELTTERGVCV